MSNYYDENELIRRIQKGDESALAIIISEYHAYVGKIVYSILGSYSHKIDLQGVVNQIFFTLWHKANKIDPSKSVTIKGYLGILARNTAINEKKKCIPDYQINDEVIADISDDFNQVELRLLLANALRKLNKDEQLILVLFYFQNEKIADISRITGIPASTVKSKLKRCKEKMKKFLEEGGNQYENFVCLPYTASEIENALHHEELPPARRTVLCVYGAVRGVGGIDSWGSIWKIVGDV